MQPVFGLKGVTVVVIVDKEGAAGKVVVAQQRKRQAAEQPRQRRRMGGAGAGGSGDGESLRTKGRAGRSDAKRHIQTLNPQKECSPPKGNPSGGERLFTSARP